MIILGIIMAILQTLDFITTYIGLKNPYLEEANIIWKNLPSTKGYIIMGTLKAIISFGILFFSIFDVLYIDITFFILDIIVGIAIINNLVLLWKFRKI